MKATVQQELCDVCGKQEVYDSCACLRCGKFVCWSCENQGHSVTLRHAIGVIGHGDGKYCATCHAAMRHAPTPLFDAYRAISALSAEYKAWHVDFDIRAKLAEALVMKLRGELENK